MKAFFALLISSVCGATRLEVRDRQPTEWRAPSPSTAHSAPSSAEASTPGQREDRSRQGTSLEIAANRSAIVVGVVDENYQGCTVDLTCYLRLRLDRSEVRVVYGRGDGAKCTNEKAARQGFEVKKGQRVKAYGQYAKLGKLHIVSTCPSEGFYILLIK